MKASEQFELLEHKETKKFKSPTGEMITMSYPPGFFENAVEEVVLSSGDIIKLQGARGLFENAIDIAISLKESSRFTQED